MTTGLPYLGSNDAVYTDPTAFSGLMKSGFLPEKHRFPGVKELAYNNNNNNNGLIATPLYPTAVGNLSDLLWANRTSVKHAAGQLCGGNFADNMECFMILTPSQQLAIAVLALTLGSFTVLENLVVLCVILHSQTLRSRPSYHFIGSLAVADLLGSVIFVYSFLDFHVLHRKDTPHIFLFKLAGVIASFSASVGSLFLTAIDRYISIHQPVAYKRIVTKAKAVAAFSAMWATSIAFSLLPLLGWNCRSLRSACSGIFPLIDRRYLMLWLGVTSTLVLFIVYAYVFILRKAHHHAVRMVSRSSQRSVIVAYGTDSSKTQTPTRPEQARMDLRLAKTLVLILATLIICWGPVLAVMVYDLFWTVSDAVKTAFAFCSMLCLLNSTVNPVIYAMRSRDLRRAFLSLCGAGASVRRASQSLDNSGESDCCWGMRGSTTGAGAGREGENYERSSRVRVARVTLSGVTETSVAEHV
ncbi:hypothetical protein CRUP_027158 [Coryphaenoides rupestris]|nr:hypothetical protein CRUP_027158 [Coryphaenoides rupestris]